MRSLRKTFIGIAIAAGVLLWLWTPSSALGQDEGASSTTDNSIYVDLGEGNGAVIIIGDGNTVYLPPKQEDGPANTATVLNNGSVVLSLGSTALCGYGVVGQVVWQKIVLAIESDGSVRVLYAQQ